MDIATMVAINNLNMVTMMQAMQQTQSVITILADGKEIKDMEGSMLDQYMVEIEILDKLFIRHI